MSVILQVRTRRPVAKILQIGPRHQLYSSRSRLALSSARSSSSWRNPLHINNCVAGVTRVIQSALSRSTSVSRQAIWKRFNRFVHLHRLRVTEASATMWLNSTHTSARTQLTYSSHLVAMFRLKTPLEAYRKGLQRIAATVPIKQAKPILPAQIARILSSHLPVHHQMQVFAA